MFSRRLFKKNSKNILRRHYGKALLAVFIVSGLSLLITLLSFEYNLAELFRVFNNMFDASIAQDSDAVSEAVASLPDALMPANLIALFNTLQAAFTLLVSTILPICFARFFLRARENPARISDLLDPFRRNYGNNLGTMYAQMIIIYLWTIVPMLIISLVIMLPTIIGLAYLQYETDSATIFFTVYFSIVGICLLSAVPATIKSYQYSMLPWIMAENSNMNFKRAFQLTKAMTRGYKWKLFVLDLSFFGWNLLAIFVPFGILFLSPYIYSTKAEAYTFLKARVIESGQATTADFPGLCDAAPSAELPAAAEELPKVEAAPEAEVAALSETVSASEAEPVAAPEAESSPASETEALPEQAASAEIGDTAETDGECTE